MVINLKVKLFDESDETDLQNAINSFLNGGNYDIIDIRYQVAISMTHEEQIYCFSAMVIYHEG